MHENLSLWNLLHFDLFQTSSVAVISQIHGCWWRLWNEMLVTDFINIHFVIKSNILQMIDVFILEKLIHVYVTTVKSLFTACRCTTAPKKMFSFDFTINGYQNITIWDIWLSKFLRRYYFSSWITRNENSQPLKGGWLLSSCFF